MHANSERTRKTAGETLVETLVAILVAAMSMVILSVSISVATTMSTNSSKMARDYYTAGNSLERGSHSLSAEADISGGLAGDVHDYSDVELALASQELPGKVTAIDYRLAGE